jgi:hypothetical protein
MTRIHTGSGAVTYKAVRKAMDGEPYTMSLTDTDEIRAVIDAVNQGIDSHLEACFCPQLGDRFHGGKRMAGRLTLCHTLECSVSPESLPVLLRRLFEGDDAGMSLAGDILMTLGFDEHGQFVGREAVPAAASRLVRRGGCLDAFHLRGC